MTGSAVALQVVTSWTQTAILNIVGLGLLAGVTATCAAVVYRRTTTRALPIGAGIIAGVAVAAAWPNYLAVDSGAVIAETPLLRYTTGYYLAAVCLVSTATATVGHQVGDRVACDVYGVDRISADNETAAVLRSGERVVTVELPEEVDTLDGYRPVSEQCLRRLEGETLLFPRRLSREELESRLERRIETDFDVDYAAATIADDGTVSTLAVGRQPPGLGPSLAPDEAAVAVRATPTPTASAGDPVEVWAGDDETLVATGTVRATVGETVTLVVDRDVADRLDVDGEYRITTRPTRTTETEAFLSVLRETPETISALTVEANGSLEGEFVSWLPMAVLAIVRDGDVIPFPEQRETLQAGDTVYVVGTPAAFEEIESFEPASLGGAQAAAGD